MSSVDTLEATPTIYHVRVGPHHLPPGVLTDLCINAWIHTGQPNPYAKPPELPTGEALSPEPLPARTMGIKLGSGRKYFNRVVRESPEDVPRISSPRATALPIELSMPVGGTVLGSQPRKPDLEHVIDLFARAEIEEQTITILGTAAANSLCAHITERAMTQPVRQLNGPVTLLAHCTLLAAIAGKDIRPPAHSHLDRRNREIEVIRSPLL